MREAKKEMNRLMRDVAILADDLTGALDAAAAFASPAEPVVVGWTVRDGARIAIDSETRAGPPAAARAKVVGFLPALANSRIAFKKVDSLLRGNSFAELAACVAGGAFDAVHVAPAFPQQGRTTEGGRLRVASAPSGDVPLSILDGLLAEGVSAVTVPAGATPPRSGISVCDARTADDLRGVVRAVSMQRRVLWCGSAGLAYALANGSGSTANAPADLAIIGSRHPVSRLSAARLRAGLGRDCVELTDVSHVGSSVGVVAHTLRERHRAALVFNLPDLLAEAAEACYRAAFAKLAEMAPKPAGVIVVGGDTLFRLVRAVGATSLATIGHRSHGLPVSRLTGGIWDGVLVTSKSGAFDDGGLFADFVQEELKSA